MMKRGKEKKKEMITKRKDWKILLKWMRINMKMKMMVSGRKERKRKEKTNGIPVVVVTQSCPTPCDPTDGSPPSSSVHGILQARILEWVGYSLFQGIFLTQGLNPGLLHCRWILRHLNHQGSHVYSARSVRWLHGTKRKLDCTSFLTQKSIFIVISFK